MKTYKERTKWFNEARFGMFIHWGLYSILARGEWVMCIERIPKEEYAKLADKFNPDKFDADKWVSLAKNAGMKYVVFTTRHHDGFCLYNSKFSDFTSVKTKTKRDFVAEYVQACRKAGLKVGFYYSLLDWRFPGYFNREKYPENFNAMVEQAHNQVRELLTNYGKIDYVFFDGEWIPGVKINRDLIGSKGESLELAKLWQAEKLIKMMRKLQPDILINNRTGLQGDFDTPEQFVTPSKDGRSWESCMTMGDIYNWGYTKNNPNMKPVSQLIQNIVTSASGGGNYLLNIGPKADGSVREEEVNRLNEIGKWMKSNKESIYGTGRVPSGFGERFGAGMLGVFTGKKNVVYLHIFRWQGKIATIAGIKNKVLKATFLTTDKKIQVIQTKDGKLFLKDLPENPPDKYDTVIKLKLDGLPKPFVYDGIPL